MIINRFFYATETLTGGLNEWLLSRGLPLYWNYSLPNVKKINAHYGHILRCSAALFCYLFKSFSFWGKEKMGVGDGKSSGSLHMCPSDLWWCRSSAVNAPGRLMWNDRGPSRKGAELKHHPSNGRTVRACDVKSGSRTNMTWRDHTHTHTHTKSEQEKETRVSGKSVLALNPRLSRKVNLLRKHLLTRIW